jgi:MFS family permease
MTANGVTPDGAASQGPQTPLPGARTALVLLLVINVFNYIDRQVLAAVEPEIRRELLQGGRDDEVVSPELRAEAKFKTGLLSTAFLITYMLSAPVFGWLADRMSRWAIVGIGVMLWSLASGASGLEWPVGLTAAFWLLFATRLFVGVGEGAYGPVAPTMLSDVYPVKDRGWVIAWFYLAIPVGGALGYALGGAMTTPGAIQAGWGWRWAFYVVVPPGLLLGLICFLMRDPPRGKMDAVKGEVKRAGRREYLDLARIPSYVLNTVGMTAMTFAIGALAYWMPAYLEEQKVEPMFGIDPRTFFGALTALAGLIATLLGGWAGDWLRGKIPGSYFVVSGVAMALGFPVMLLFVSVPFPLAWVFAFLAVFLLFFNTGPTNAILANVTHPAQRAAGFAVNILIIHALGDAISPPIIGYIAGWTSMRVGFIVVSGFMVVGGLIWLWGARHLERDTAAAPTRLEESVVRGP